MDRTQINNRDWHSALCCDANVSSTEIRVFWLGLWKYSLTRYSCNVIFSFSSCEQIFEGFTIIASSTMSISPA